MANKKIHLTYEEKFCIEKMLRAGNGINYIARALSRGVSTISQEVSNNGGKDRYRANDAEEKAKLSQNNKKKNLNKILCSNDLLKFVNEHIDRGYSPEAISKLSKNQNDIVYISGKSIRRYININKHT